MHKIVRLSVIAAVAILGLSALVAAQSIPSTTAENEPVDAPVSPFAQVIGGDETALRELLSRVVSSSAYPPDKAVVYVGTLPDNLPFDLPLPEGARTIGSVFYGSSSFTQIILDVPQTPDEVMQFFQAALSSGGWSSLDAQSSPSGFVLQPWRDAYFCYQGDKAFFRVNAQGTQAPADVSLYITAPADTTACVGAGAGAAPGLPYTLLPQLQVPDGVTVVPDDRIQSLGTPEHTYAAISAVLSSQLSVAKIADAYHAQLTDIGWHLVSQEVGDKMAWSGWTLQDADGKTWAGTFMLIPNTAAEDQYAAQVMVEAVPAEP